MPVNRIDSIVVLTICAEVDMRLLTELNHGESNTCDQQQSNQLQTADAMS